MAATTIYTVGINWTVSTTRTLIICALVSHKNHKKYMPFHSPAKCNNCFPSTVCAAVMLNRNRSKKIILFLNYDNTVPTCTCWIHHIRMMKILNNIWRAAAPASQHPFKRQSMGGYSTRHLTIHIFIRIYRSRPPFFQPLDLLFNAETRLISNRGRVSVRFTHCNGQSNYRK